MRAAFKPASALIACGMLALLIACMTAESSATHAAAPGTTYYVDAAAGNDANSGTSAGAPWRTLDKVNAATFQPGDLILLKAGSSWTGQLRPKGSGTDGAPIVVDMYGEGPKPAIHGAGLYPETVKLFNQQYWEIGNLELTNVGEERQTRRAVWIEAQDIGTARHIHLQNLDIHDVNGQTQVQDLESGGIIVRVTGSATPTKFDDVLIENNTFADVDSTGIFVRSNWRNRDTRTDGVGPWLGMTNVVIRGNSLNRTGGDAIIVCEGDGPLVEHNVAAHSYYDSVGYHAAIWAINSDDALFQYNEAYATHNTLDGMAFDIDELCNNCVMQYNYSHDNEGGFMLLVGQRGEGTGYDRGGIVRYNVSENDGTALIQAVGRLDDYRVYNNTFYVGPGMNTRFLMAPDGNNLPQGTLSFRNNIVYNLGENLTYYCGNATCTFEGNTYYGNHDPSEPADASKLTSDPGLLAPGSGGIGRQTLDGYKLVEGSPSLGSGAPVAGNGGRDFWGNAVSAPGSPNRGAYGGPGVPDENVGGGIHSYVLQKSGSEVRLIRAEAPTTATVKANKPITVTDSEGRSSTYRPSQGNLIYLTIPADALKLTGDIKSIKPGGKYSLTGGDAYRTDELPLVLHVDNTSAPRAHIDAQFVIGGTTVPVEVAPGQTADIAVPLPGYETAGSYRLVGDIVSGGKAVARLTRDIVVQEPLQMQARHEADAGSERLEVSVRNDSDRTRTLQELAWTIGEAAGAMPLNAVQLPVGAETSFDVPLSGLEPSRRYPFTVMLHAAGGLSLGAEGSFTAVFPLTQRSIVADGEPDDLTAVPGVELPRQGRIEMPVYGGDNDLGGDVWVTWDEEHLNISAAIRDDSFSQTRSQSQIWMGDSVQFAVSPGMPGDSGDWHEFGMALTPEGPQLYRWTGIGRSAGLVATSGLSIVRDEASGVTLYELALPWTELVPISPVDVAFAFSLLVNDDDGAGRKGWIEWGSGIGGSKDPGQYISVLLTGPVDRVLVGLSIPQTLAYSVIPVTLTAVAAYDDGFQAKTAHAQWSTSDADIATVAGGVVTFTGNTGAVTIIASYGGYEASVSAVIEELVQYYPFDEGQGAKTREANGGVIYDIEGTPVWVDGKVGKALLFYGNSIRISPLAKDDFTFMAWIKPESYDFNHHIVGQGMSGSQANMFNWWISNGQMYFLVSDAEGQGHGMWPFNTDVGSIPLDEWTHVAAVREGNEFRMYINGTRVLSKTVDYHQNQLDNPNPFRIGAQNGPDGQPSEGFHGAIDELKLYPEALDDGQIRQAWLGSAGDGEGAREGAEAGEGAETGAGAGEGAIP